MEQSKHDLLKGIFTLSFLLRNSLSRAANNNNEQEKSFPSMYEFFIKSLFSLRPRPHRHHCRCSLTTLTTSTRNRAKPLNATMVFSEKKEKQRKKKKAS